MDPLRAWQRVFGRKKNLTSEIIVSLDDDLFFVREPDFSLKESDFLARPVDVKGMCTTGTHDPFDSYWRAIVQLPDYEHPDCVNWTTDEVPIGEWLFAITVLPPTT
jgi:hypothetical protein